MESNRFTIWRKAWEAYLLGTDWDPENKDARAILASMERIVSQGLNPQKHQDESDCIYGTPFYGLRALALAYRTKGTKQYNDPSIRNTILEQLVQLYKTNYNPERSPQTRENWWGYEIGMPLRILDTLVLMYDELPDKEILDRYTETILANRDVYKLSARGRTETGANMMWKCHVLLLTGILREEQEWIDWANEQIVPLFRYSHSINIPGTGKMYDDGFYPDGSFLQHYMFAYTGGYGKHLLYNISELLYAFRGTDCLQLPEECIRFLCERIEDTWAPLMIHGHFMDIARGREVSRYWHQDREVGALIIRAGLYLAQGVSSPYKEKIEARVKEWISWPGMRDSVLYDDCWLAEYFALPSLADVLHDLDDSPVPAALPPMGHFSFAVMNKPVHRTDAYTCALSMYSRNIGMYEKLGTECNKQWHIADGVTYLYLSDPDAFCGNYYATADMQRLPGTTVERSQTREQDPYYDWYKPEIRNSFSFTGSTSLGNLAAAGMQYRGQGNGKQRSLDVRKSWFFFPEEIICMGSGITSDTENPVETILLNQKLRSDASNLFAVYQQDDGRLQKTEANCHSFYGKELCFKDVRALSLNGNTGRDSDLGICFCEPAEVRGLMEHRRGTWNSVEINPDHYEENEHAALWLPHGKSPVNAKYAYVLLPGRSGKKLEEYCETLPVRILENSNRAHAVFHPLEKATAINFWEEKEYSCMGVKCDTQACVLLKQEDDHLSISVSDPSKDRDNITLTLDQKAVKILESDEKAEVLSLFPLTIRFHTAGTDGSAVKLKVSVESENLF